MFGLWDMVVINPAERNALVGIKPTVGLTSRAGYEGLPFFFFFFEYRLFVLCSCYGTSVVPESIHQDTVGTFARTVRDAVYVLDAIYGVDPRDNYTFAQVGKTPVGGYTQFLSNSTALRGATFGLPWKSFWALASEEQQVSLMGLVELVKRAGATVVNGTELPNYETIVSPDGWNWWV